MKPAGSEEAPEKTWKRVAKLALWLYLLMPVGLWKLWQDPLLSASAKWRIFLYLFVIPFLVYIAVSIEIVNHSLQRLIP